MFAADASSTAFTPPPPPPARPQHPPPPPTPCPPTPSLLGALGAPCRRAPSVRKLLGPGGEMLGDELQNLRAGMSAASSPPFSRVRRFDGVADVLAIPLADLAQHTTIGPSDLARVALAGAHLLAADEQLVRSVDRRQSLGKRDRGNGKRGCRCSNVSRFSFLVSRMFPCRLQILIHPFPPTLAAKPRLPIATEPRRGVEQIR